MKITYEISGLQGCVEVAWAYAKPALLGHPYDDGTVTFKNEHCAISQPFSAVECDDDFGILVGSAAQPSTQRIIPIDSQYLNPATVLQIVKSVRDRWLACDPN